MNKKRVDITCRCSLLVIFVMFLGCTLFFNHTHISDGNIIVHSHPFKADKDGKPLHNHMDYSYMLINMLNNFIANNSPLILLAALFLYMSRELLGVIKESYPAGNGVLQYQQRGPPSIML
jgi:hypothetical protein